MKLMRYRQDGREGLAIVDGAQAHGRLTDDPGYPGELAELIAAGGDALARAADALHGGVAVALDAVEYLPPLGRTGKILCLGLNYPDHAKETKMDAPSHPTIFVRFPSSFVGHRTALVRPRASTHFDYEGELVAVIGKGGRHIAQADALSHVAGYSIFNDGSVRDFQLETPQWTVGKNFDRTGAFGPWFVTADALPPGGAGLKLQTRLNGQVVQSAPTSEMIFDVASTIAFLSQAMTLEPGDILVMGTPPGVGMARDPKLFMKAGDRCEVEIEGIGVLSNPVVDEA